jgi:hypothetical protein
MNLIEKFNVSTSEDQMQKAVADYFSNYEFDRLTGYEWKAIKGKVYREVTIPTIGRRSDVIIKITDFKIFNIECKTNDLAGVIEQAKDHLFWADYSYICVHAKTYIAPYFITDMIEHGIGLLLWQNANEADKRVECIVDVFGAGKNTYSEGKKDKSIREMVLKRLKEIDSAVTGQSHKQLTIEP